MISVGWNVSIGQMRAFRPQLIWAISISSLFLAHSQKCDINLYSAPCGETFAVNYRPRTFRAPFTSGLMSINGGALCLDFPHSYLTAFCVSRSPELD